LIDDAVLETASLCHPCLSVFAEKLKKKQEEFKKMIDDGVDPRIANRIMIVKLDKEGNEK